MPGGAEQGSSALPGAKTLDEEMTDYRDGSSRLGRNPIQGFAGKQFTLSGSDLRSARGPGLFFGAKFQIDFCPASRKYKSHPDLSA